MRPVAPGILVLGLGLVPILEGCRARPVDREPEPGLPAVPSSVVPRARLDLSPPELRELGAVVAARVLSRRSPAGDPALEAYVALVGQSVLASPEPRRAWHGYRFVVLEGQRAETFASPCGCIFVSRGALGAAEDEDEVAALLAREIAHVSLLHPLTVVGAGTMERLRATASPGDAGVSQRAEDGTQEARERLARLLHEVAEDVEAALLDRGYSDELEIEADRVAVGYLRSAGYDPGALQDLLRRRRASSEVSLESRARERAALDARLGALARLDLPSPEAGGRALRKVRFLAAAAR